MWYVFVLIFTHICKSERHLLTRFFNLANGVIAKKIEAGEGHPLLVLTPFISEALCLANGTTSYGVKTKTPEVDAAEIFGVAMDFLTAANALRAPPASRHTYGYYHANMHRCLDENSRHHLHHHLRALVHNKV